MVDVAHTSDWTDADVEAFVELANRLGARPLDIGGCWMSESGLHTTAHNVNGDAVGLFQAMPATLRGMGFSGGWKAFAALSIRDQLKWALEYYAPHKGKLVSPGACYLATFLPALMSHAADPTFVLCATLGPHAAWYAANKGLDVDHDGAIRVQDLTDRIARVQTGARWDEFAARVHAAMQDAPTQPELVAADDAPVFVLDALDSDPPPDPQAA